MPADSDVSAPKAAARAAFERGESELVELSQRIHAHPEIKFEEERACAWLGEALTGYGFDVESRNEHPDGDDSYDLFKAHGILTRLWRNVIRVRRGEPVLPRV